MPLQAGVLTWRLIGKPTDPELNIVENIFNYSVTCLMVCLAKNVACTFITTSVCEHVSVFFKAKNAEKCTASEVRTPALKKIIILF